MITTPSPLPSSPLVTEGFLLATFVPYTMSKDFTRRFFSGPPAVNDQTAELTATGEANHRGRSSEDSQAQQTETMHTDRGREPLQDGQRWHQAWALENLPPHAYAEFVRLRPGRVADLDRRVRRKGVPRGIAAGD